MYVTTSKTPSSCASSNPLHRNNARYANQISFCILFLLIIHLLSTSDLWLPTLLLSFLSPSVSLIFSFIWCVCFWPPSCFIRRQCERKMNMKTCPSCSPCFLSLADATSSKTVECLTVKRSRL